jgi:hypothetical protein
MWQSVGGREVKITLSLSKAVRFPGGKVVLMNRKERRRRKIYGDGKYGIRVGTVEEKK